MMNIVADGRQRDSPSWFSCRQAVDAQVVQSLLQQVRVSTNALASRLSLAALQQFIHNKGLVLLLHSFHCEPKRWVLVSNQLFHLSRMLFVRCSLARVSA